MKPSGNYLIKENDLKAIESAKELLKQNFPVLEVVLFGSKVRGDDNEESDIDLLLLTSRPVLFKERKAITYALYEVQLSYDVIFSTLIVHENEWHNGTFSVMPIYHEISREGVRI